MRLAFAGTPAPAVPALAALIASPHDVVAVISRPDARSGRGRSVTRSPVATAADEAGIEVLTPSTPNSPEFRDELGALNVDCVAVVAYGSLLSAELLAIPHRGWVNLHFSLLPAWRGAAPVQHALLHGDEVTGATTFLLESGMDTGPVFGVVTERIRARDTSGDLLGRLAHSGAQLLAATMDGIADGSLLAQPQSSVDVSYAPKISVDDARVEWATPAQHIDRLCRATAPTPGAWTTFRGDRLKLAPVAVASEGPAESLDSPASGAALLEAPLAPGELRVGKRAVWVGTGTSAVRLSEVQAVGKKPMAATDWARGVRPVAGERLQ